MSLVFSHQPLPVPSYQDTQLKKIDILFYDSIKQLKSTYTNHIFYHFLKGLIFIIFIPIDYAVIKSPNDNGILAAMIFALVSSLLQCVSLLLWRFKSLRNNKLLLRIGKHMNHCTQEQIKINNISSLQQCVSKTMYNKHNETLITNQGLTQKIKDQYTRILSIQIKDHIKNEEDLISRVDTFFGFLGFISMVYAIIALSVSEKNTAELVLLIIYIILEGFSKIFIILIFVFVALSPLLCLVCIFCACCCSRSQQGAVKLPIAQKATQKMVTDADGTCSICYQDFIIGSDVIRLKCSQKHIFHPICIQGWIKVRSNCPICRTTINDDVNRSAPI